LNQKEIKKQVPSGGKTKTNHTNSGNKFNARQVTSRAITGRNVSKALAYNRAGAGSGSLSGNSGGRKGASNEKKQPVKNNFHLLPKSRSEKARYSKTLPKDVLQNALNAKTALGLENMSPQTFTDYLSVFDAKKNSGNSKEKSSKDVITALKDDSQLGRSTNYGNQSSQRLGGMRPRSLSFK